MSLNKFSDFESFKEMRLLSADFIGASRVESAKRPNVRLQPLPQHITGRFISQNREASM
jgi:hypothetical protein